MTWHKLVIAPIAVMAVVLAFGASSASAANTPPASWQVSTPLLQKEQIYRYLKVQQTSPPQARPACPWCIVIVSVGARALAAKLVVKPGVKLLARSAVRRLPRARRAIFRAAKKIKDGFMPTVFDVKRSLVPAAVDCMAFGGATYWGTKQWRVGVMTCGTAAWHRIYR